MQGLMDRACLTNTGFERLPTSQAHPEGNRDIGHRPAPACAVGTMHCRWKTGGFRTHAPNGENGHRHQSRIRGASQSRMGRTPETRLESTCRSYRYRGARQASNLEIKFAISLLAGVGPFAEDVLQMRARMDVTQTFCFALRADRCDSPKLGHAPKCGQPRFTLTHVHFFPLGGDQKRMQTGPSRWRTCSAQPATRLKERLETMTRTRRIQNQNRQFIGFDEPFCVIGGTRINPRAARSTRRVGTWRFQPRRGRLPSHRPRRGKHSGR